MTTPTSTGTTAVARTMRAWMQTRYGGPDVVQFESVEVPAPGADEVLLRVRAASLNSGDVHVMRGDPWLVRAAFGVRRPRAKVRGMDAAGTVIAVGSAVAAWRPGDEVVGELPGGALGEYAVAPAARLVSRPPELDPAQAAGLPVAGGTAWQALHLGAVASGSRVLVLGAGGGVGTFVVQLAALRGAEIWATCGARAEALLGDLGAARTFDYRATTLGDLPHAPFDAVIDIAGTEPLRALRALVRDGGSVVLVSGAGGRLLGPMGRLARAAVLSIGARVRLRPLLARPKPDVLRELVGLAAGGRLRTVIDRTYPLADARDAVRHVDDGHTVGKVVVLNR